MPIGFGRTVAAALAIVALGATALIAAREQARIRVGGGIERPRLVTRVAPVYPADAKAEGVEGLVILEVVIGTDGKVVDVDIIRSADPRLDHAAEQAVAQWAYTPTLLNGEPVEVVMTVNVMFAIDKRDQPAQH